MKKLFLIFGAAALFFSSCQKGVTTPSSWMENESSLATGREISFLPVSQATKAGMVETTAVKNFNVYAWKSDGSEYFGVHTTYTNGIYENVSQSYWPLDESLTFLPISPVPSLMSKLSKVMTWGSTLPPGISTAARTSWLPVPGVCRCPRHPLLTRP